MKKDIFERMKLMKKQGIKPNYSATGRIFGCDYRTSKKYYESDNYEDEGIRIIGLSKLDPYKDIIEDKVELGCSAMSIYKFLIKKGYEGK